MARAHCHAGSSAIAAGRGRTHHSIQGLGSRAPADRGGRMKQFAPGGQRQRGVALIIALILVALATILATKLTFDGFMERQRTVSVLAGDQAMQFGYGAEALAADILTAQGSTQQVVTLADPWAQPTQPMPITPQSDPE